ncbi:amino acid permease [uncultured Brevibacillus sp.]|uniref:amino acid permease n=1 Tax=uncultured Brevibacillus sp. TaxID=169970 RepID=UPI002596B844|nr:amino acid permease [uncultured Brevibacillus sp.]
MQIETRHTEGNLSRELKSRHLTMITIGGAIGTGLFLASGATISTAGPGGALTAYLVIGAMIYFLMTSLGELSTYMPTSGSFETYATKFVDPALGFALGWNYWFGWAITIAVEISAGALLMKYWFPDTPSILWSSLFLLLLFGLNLLSAKAYGESEFWFASIKVVIIIIFLIVGTLMIFGIMGGQAIGIQNIMMEGAMFHGGLMSMIGIFMIAGFSFIGTELVGVVAGESENPERNVPKAIKSIFWRILVFYILTILIIGFVIPYNDPNLLNSSIDNITISPFTLVFEKAGLALAAAVMNAVILTSVLSVGNSSIYAASRMLYAMTKSGKAPKVFGLTNTRGVPIYAVCASALVGMTCFLSSLYGDGTIYVWLLNCSALTGFITWVGIALSHYRFRKAFLAQGRDLNELPYKARWFPFGPIFSFVLCSAVILGQNYQAFFKEAIDWHGIIVSYVGLPLFLLLYLGYKIGKKTKVIPLKEVDFTRE